jgi:hypothetical protein
LAAFGAENNLKEDFRKSAWHVNSFVPPGQEYKTLRFVGFQAHQWD